MSVEVLQPIAFFPNQLVEQLPPGSYLNDLVDRIRGVTPPFFVVYDSPWAIISFLSKRIIQLITTWVASVQPFLEGKVKELSLKIQTLFNSLATLFMENKNVSNLIEGFLSSFIYDRKFSEKIAAEQKLLFHKTGTSLYGEMGKLLAKYGLDCIQHHIQYAKEIDQEIRPEVLSFIVTGEKEESRYTFLGQQIALYMQKNSEFINKVIELNILKVFSSVVDCLHKVQNESQFALLDLIKDSLSKSAVHFCECHGRASEQILAQLPEHVGEVPLISVEEEEIAKQEYRRLFFKTLSGALLNIGLPNKGKDLELPLSPFLSSYLSSYIFDQLKEVILPQALEIGFSLLGTQFVKDLFFIQGFELMHELIDGEYQPYEVGQVKIHYQEQAELAKSLEDSILSFLDYVDSSYLPWIFKTFATKKIAEASGEAIIMQWQSVTFQDIFMYSLEEFAPVLNPGGAWVEEDGQKRFQSVPFKFESTLAERRASGEAFALTVAEQRKKLEDLVSIIGNEGKGLIQAAQDKVFAVTSANAAPEAKVNISTEQWGFFEGIKKNINNIYEVASEIMVKGSFHVMGVSEKVQALNKEIFEKINKQEHEQMYYDISESIMTVLGQKVTFPTIRDSRYKQKNK